MKKYLFFISCFFSFCVWTQEVSHSQELEMIDRKIEELKSRLQRSYLMEMQDEVEGQGLMIANWEAYAQEIKRIRQYDEEEQQLQQQIDKLEERKVQLLKQLPSNQKS